MDGRYIIGMYRGGPHPGGDRPSEEHKWCSYGQHWMLITEFGSNTSRNDSLSTNCRKCDSSKAMERQKRTADARRVRNRSIVEEKRQIGCQACGETDPAILDFHHIDPQQKRGDIGWCVNQKTTTFLMDELERCVLVCANCHRRLEAGRICIISGRIGGDAN